MNSENGDELPIFIKWLDYLKWLLQTVEKFPKRCRATFTDRMINMGFDVVEDLTEARYTRNKIVTLRRANLTIEKLRLMTRIAFESRLLSQQSYKHAVYSMNEVGKMLGGWLKQQEGKE